MLACNATKIISGGKKHRWNSIRNFEKVHIVAKRAKLKDSFISSVRYSTRSFHRRYALRNEKSCSTEKVKMKCNHRGKYVISDAALLGIGRV